MKIRSQLLNRLGGLLTALLVRQWIGTVNMRAVFYDPTVDPVHPEYRGQKIYLFWHEYILMPLYIRGHCDLVMLLSRHQDAEILSHVARHMGYDTVRGSTARGGVAALRELLRKSKNMNLTIVPDGPRGPRRVLAPGPIYLSSKLQMPLVLMGIGVDRPWRVNSWDRFAIPRPFSQVRGVISPEVQIPKDLDRDGIEHYRQVVERMLNRLSDEAEAWAESGTRKIGEQAIRREPSRNRLWRVDPPQAVQPPEPVERQLALPHQG